MTESCLKYMQMASMNQQVFLLRHSALCCAEEKSCSTTSLVSTWKGDHLLIGKWSQ